MVHLKQIDLSMARKHECPGVKDDGSIPYLAKIGGMFYAGTFSHQWYGLNFNFARGGTGVQFDAPGYNSSSWEGLWEILE